MKKLSRLLGRVLAFLFALLLFAEAYLVIILLNDPDRAAPESPSPAVTLSDLPQEVLTFAPENAYQARAYFDCPLLQLSESSGCAAGQVTLNGSGSAARTAEFTYTLPSGALLTLCTRTPADAVHSFSREGLLPVAGSDWSLGGLTAACLTDGHETLVYSVQGSLLYTARGAITPDEMRSVLSHTFFEE